ncbi:hypothetical protein JCM5296_000958, partial [Sporobolomyces johnsonii]
KPQVRWSGAAGQMADIRGGKVPPSVTKVLEAKKGKGGKGKGKRAAPGDVEEDPLSGDKENVDPGPAAGASPLKKARVVASPPPESS